MHRSQQGGYPTAAAVTTALVPYLQGPFPDAQVGTNQNVTVGSSAQSPITTPAAGANGWVYNETTGEIQIKIARWTPRALLDRSQREDQSPSSASGKYNLPP